MDVQKLRQLMEEQLKLSRRLKARVRELEMAQRAPLAVVGMALRLPGDITTPESYWSFLRGNDSVLSEIPDDRPGLRSVYDPKPDRTGRSYVKRAGFLKDIASFDADFFRIAQREAETLDPQQRLLLETGWEAMERAGIAVRREDRLPVGVFVGIMGSDYRERMVGHADKRGIDPYFGTGSGLCFAAGRISYSMGFSGPALSVDTACSSSLVAFHLGAQSVRRGECRYALVGGANLMFSPDLMVSLCQSRALGLDGRSKTFAAAADGYGRGEGVGVLVLMRLDHAEQEGRPILAVLRGTAVNHDGASSGLTVPNGPAQQDVVRAALADAGVAPEELGYVETHGTGTSLGDPIEVGALNSVVGTGAPNRPAPLAIGSVKSRIGHLEAAAGVAGLMKVILMLQHGEIPATLSDGDGALNPLIPWRQLNVTVPRRLQLWPDTFARRIAGISAFGLSGTNSHAILEAYESEPAERGGTEYELLTLSAKDAEGLRQLAEATTSYLAKLDAALLPSACHTMRVGRIPFEQRIAVTGKNAAELAAKLTAAMESSSPDVAQSAAKAANVRVGLDSAVIVQGIAVLTSTFPLLAAAIEDTDATPAALLQQLLRRLGVAATPLSVPACVDPLVELEWGGRTYPLLAANPDTAPVLLLDALAALFVAGANLRLEALHTPGVRFLSELPTYPFRRKRYWIDESLATQGAAETSPANAAPQQTDLHPDSIKAVLLSELNAVLHLGDDFELEHSLLEIGSDSFTAMLFKKGVEMHYNIEIPLDEFSAELPLSELLDRLSLYIEQAVAQVAAPPE